MGQPRLWSIMAMAEAANTRNLLKHVGFILERDDYDALVNELTQLYGHQPNAGSLVYVTTCLGPTPVRAAV